MDYESWLNILDKLKNGYIDNNLLKEMQESEINNNINGMLILKIDALIRERFEISISKVTKNLTEIFTDINYLDLTLVNFKKEVKFLIAMSKLKQLPTEKQQELINKIKEGTEQVYTILVNESVNIDPKGIYAQTIINNKVKWSDITWIITKQKITLEDI